MAGIWWIINWSLTGALSTVLVSEGNVAPAPFRAAADSGDIEQRGRRDSGHPGRHRTDSTR